MTHGIRTLSRSASHGDSTPLWQRLPIWASEEGQSPSDCFPNDTNESGLAAPSKPPLPEQVPAPKAASMSGVVAATSPLTVRPRARALWQSLPIWATEECQSPSDCFPNDTNESGRRAAPSEPPVPEQVPPPRTDAASPPEGGAQQFASALGERLRGFTRSLTAAALTPAHQLS